MRYPLQLSLLNQHLHTAYHHVVRLIRPWAFFDYNLVHGCRPVVVEALLRVLNSLLLLLKVNRREDAAGEMALDLIRLVSLFGARSI